MTLQVRTYVSMKPYANEKMFYKSEQQFDKIIIEQMFVYVKNKCQKEGEKFMKKVRAAPQMLVALMTTLFGAYWYIFLAYLICNILDYLTGWYKAYLFKQESSAVGLRGILKKTGYWVMIVVAFLTGEVFVRLGEDILHINLSFMMMVGWFTLACLLVNEIRSILENLVACGCHVPEILIQGLAMTEKILTETPDEPKASKETSDDTSTDGKDKSQQKSTKDKRNEE